MFFRWFLIACATVVCAFGFMACGGMHQVAMTPFGYHIQWWMLATLLVFGFCWMKVRK